MKQRTQIRTDVGRWASLPVLFAAGVIAVVSVTSTAFGQDKAPATGQLLQRIEQLEEQIVDLQVVIGTLQSMPRGGPQAPVAGAPVGGASDTARLDGMETQIRALTAQVAQLADQIRSLDSGARRGALDGGYPQQPQQPAAPAAVADRALDTAGTTGTVQSFGSTEVLPSERPGGAPAAVDDPIGGFLEDPAGGRAVASRGGPAATGGIDPKQQYETAYGYLLQQQYGAAENAFRDFVRDHPNNPLAGNAQYWLGESFYVRGQYKAAANAFLKGYETFSKSSKAPESLLKLALSLEQLGHKDAACSSLAELKTRFPNAPAHVTSRVASERSRVGC